MSITDLKNDACASLWLKPCTFGDLCKRLDRTEKGFWSLIKSAIDSGLLYENHGVLYCKKSTAKKLQSTGDYDLF